MPVIAINVSTEVADYYNSLKKGTKSKHFSNVLSRHVRLSSNIEYQGMSYEQLETVIQQREDAIEKLQAIISTVNNRLASMEKEAAENLKRSFIKNWLKYFSRR